MALIKEIKELLPLNPLYSEELKQYLANFSPNQPSLLADFSAALTTASGTACRKYWIPCRWCRAWKKCWNCCARSARWPSAEPDHQPGQRKVSSQQREFFLREQMKIIQKELGISRTTHHGRGDVRAAHPRPDPAARRRAAHRGGDAQALGTGNRLTRVRCDPQLPRLGHFRTPGVYTKDQLDLKHARRC